MTEARERLDATLAAADDATVGTVSGDLLAVSGLLGREAGLARALADPGAAPEARVTLVDTLLGDRVSAASLDLLRAVVGLRWSSSADLVDGVETLGAQGAFAVGVPGRDPRGRRGGGAVPVLAHDRAVRRSFVRRCPTPGSPWRTGPRSSAVC